MIPEYVSSQLSSLVEDLAAVDSHYVMLAMILVSAAIVLDSVTAYIRSKRVEGGVSSSSTIISVDDAQGFPSRHYVSEAQGLAGRPDALIKENGFIIPVERKPLARKIRDRYVAQLLVYMRLVEEFEGKKPPYGYLILGPSCRRFKIENSSGRQAWLQKMLDEMRQVLDGAPAKASPHPRKCSKCDVREHCLFAASVPCAEEKSTLKIYQALEPQGKL